MHVITQSNTKNINLKYLESDINQFKAVGFFSCLNYIVINKLR